MPAAQFHHPRIIPGPPLLGYPTDERREQRRQRKGQRDPEQRVEIPLVGQGPDEGLDGDAAEEAETELEGYYGRSRLGM